MPRTSALTKPALESSKEVLTVIKFNISLGQQAGFGMPTSGRVRTSICPTGLDATRVSGYRAVVVDATAKGAFPGTSAWSPPI